MTQAQATNAKLALLRHIERLQREDKWDRDAFKAALHEAIAIREAMGDTRSSLEWLYNEADREWLEGIVVHDDAEFTTAEMTVPVSTPTMSSWHVGVAAEAIAAAQFARCGYDVSVQYGANQPEYDLIVARGDAMLKVSVKGSQDGGWGLTQGFKKGASYHEAADAWARRHKARTVICFVQFAGVSFDQLPRLYLATASEVAAHLKGQAAGRGDTILYEKHAWKAHAAGAGTVDEIPAGWRFTAGRVADLLLT